MRKALSVCFVFAVINIFMMGIAIGAHADNTVSRQNAEIDGKDYLYTSDYEYVIDNGSVRISEYIGTAAEVVTPSSIDGYPVTEISGYAFSDCDHVTSVVISEGVTEIGWRIFEKCSNLKSVVFPNSLTYVSTAPFSECPVLESVTLGTGVTNYRYAFDDIWSSLKNIYVRDASVWCKCMFDSDPMLSAINLYVIDENGNEVSEVILDRTVTSIPDYRFRGSSFTSITIPDSVTSIGDSAFRYSKNLSTVTIPGSVAEIGTFSFADCESLKSVVFESGVTYIQYGMFLGCDNLESVTIPTTVTRITQSAFADCNNIQTVYYGGSEEQWNEITIHPLNHTLLDANIIFNAGVSIPGDLDGDAEVSNTDVQYLLWHTLFPEDYPLSVNADFDGDASVTNTDVQYLLWHTLFPEDYPLVSS